MKNILFVAPLPPPVNGQSKASKVVLDTLREEFHVEVVNLSKTSLKSGSFTLRRIWEIFQIIIEIRSMRKGKDILFLSLAESKSGNLRDLLIYFFCKARIPEIYIQMLGGAEMKNILDAEGRQNKLNRKFLQKVKGILVEGSYTFEMYKKVVPEHKIHLIPNFAEDYLFSSPEKIRTTFSELKKIKILFLSNLLPGKGYLELAATYFSLPMEIQAQIQITFVGGFESSEDQNLFLGSIRGFEGLNYLGAFIDGMAKKKLFENSHVFCLPSYYLYEGQPISILEAYATGCVVISTSHSGIPYIFKGELNGYEVEKKSVPSLTAALKRILIDKEKLIDTALYNYSMASEKFKKASYQQKIRDVFFEKLQKPS